MIELYRNKQECCGCMACRSVCPTRAIKEFTDEEGFLYPQINRELCLECGLCKQVCAFQQGYETSEDFEEPLVYAAKHKSDEVRMNSSSGGVFTGISDYVLSQNGVIYGAAFDEFLRVTHQRAESAEERNKMRGSKYVQSDLGDIFYQAKQDLDNDRIVLFTGTPCQIGALYRYLKSTATNFGRLITVDFICFGVTSPRVFADYIAFCQEKNKSRIIKYYFRSKAKGWGHTEETVYENKKRDYKSVLSQAYKELFHSKLCLRFSCYNCKYTNFDRPSDITIGDYWGIENCLPNFNDQLGVSAIIINTCKGKSVFSHLEKWLDITPSNINDCSTKQRNLCKPTPQNPKRKEFWADYSKHGFSYILRKYTRYGVKRRAKGFLIQILRKTHLVKPIRKVLGK